MDRLNLNYQKTICKHDNRTKSILIAIIISILDVTTINLKFTKNIHKLSTIIMTSIKEMPIENI